MSKRYEILDYDREAMIETERCRREDRGEEPLQIARKRCPRSFGIVHELTAFGSLALFIAADRYDPDSGHAFSTYANHWIKKYVRLYLEEIVGVIPRTGHMGIEEQGEWECGPWVVYKPRRSVMDLFNAALEQHRLYRGKAAGGMAMFDGSLTIPGPDPGDKEIEVVGTDGQTNPERLDYLQRAVGMTLFPWVDEGGGVIVSRALRLAKPKKGRLYKGFAVYVLDETGRHTFALSGHPGGKASDEPAGDESYELAEPGEYGDPGPNIVPAEICYLDKRCGRFNSYDNFTKPEYRPKTMLVPNVPHWSNSRVFAVEWLRRHRRWRKPTCEEYTYAALAA